jgi:carboxyl-terminal processing protease
MDSINFSTNTGRDNKKPLWLLFIAVAIVLSFWAGFWRGQATCPPLPPADADMTLFWETWHTLEDKFVDKDKIDHQKMIYGAISGMVSSLGDPYTAFFNPPDTKKFVEDTSGSFEGVGMEIGIKKGQLQVITPLENSPAKKAGIRAGDAIIKIDNESTANMTTDEAVDLIRGPKGTEVTLTLFREDWKETRDIKLTRAVIEVPSLKWEIKEGDIAYIQLFQFTEKASNDFKAAAVDIINSPAKRIILDLRNNPGGYLSVSQDIAGWFLKKGQVVTHETSSDPINNVDYFSEGPSLLLKYPVVVLINEGSASASEILAGALRDNRQVKLIGEKSFGKGSVQQLLPFGDGSSLKVTIAKWLTPNGDQINEKGLSPDIEAKKTVADEDSGKDPQLDKAIEIVKEIK